jgi:hypothetical protein
MPPLTLVQKRALLAAMNNTQKLEKERTRGGPRQKRLIYPINGYHSC